MLNNWVLSQITAWRWLTFAEVDILQSQASNMMKVPPCFPDSCWQGSKIALQLDAWKIYTEMYNSIV